jgi:hypothetical protein
LKIEEIWREAGKQGISVESDLEKALKTTFPWQEEDQAAQDALAAALTRERMQKEEAARRAERKATDGDDEDEEEVYLDAVPVLTSNRSSARIAAASSLMWCGTVRPVSAVASVYISSTGGARSGSPETRDLIRGRIE